MSVYRFIASMRSYKYLAKWLIILVSLCCGDMPLVSEGFADEVMYVV